MASVSFEDDSASQDLEVSNSHGSSVCSRFDNKESLEDYESSDSDDSNCSVTSGRKVRNGYHKDLIGPFDDPQATGAIVSDQMSDATDSAYTSWTDEKHSSYLNSIEATFVQRMYDKEYCSLDVCGQSGHSSVTFEQDCVESHPFCASKTQQQAGGFTYEGSCSPCFIVPSVLANPWIQHFKSKQAAPVGTEKKKLQNLHASSWNRCFPVQPRLSANRNIRKASLFPEFQSAIKKRGATFTMTDCRQSLTQSSGYCTSMQNNLAGRLAKFRKIKCQQMLSQIDLEMEEQFIWQQRNKYDDADPANEEDHQKMPQSNNLSELIKSPNSDDRDVAEIEIPDGKELIVTTYEREPASGPIDEHSSPPKIDQVVPFLKDGVTEKADKSNMVPEALVELFVSNGKDDSPFSSKQATDLTLPSKNGVLEPVVGGVQDEGEDGPGRDTTEPENASKRVGTHTLTWGIQGPRHQLSGKKSCTQFKYLI